MTIRNQVKLVFLTVKFRNPENPVRHRIQAAAEVLRLIYGGGNEQSIA